LGSDILCRVLKKKINYQIHQKLQQCNKQKSGELHNEEMDERNEIMSENYFKSLLTKILSMLLIGESVIFISFNILIFFFKGN